MQEALRNNDNFHDAIQETVQAMSSTIGALLKLSRENQDSIKRERRAYRKIAESKQNEIDLMTKHQRNLDDALKDSLAANKSLHERIAALEGEVKVLNELQRNRDRGESTARRLTEMLSVFHANELMSMVDRQEKQERAVEEAFATPQTPRPPAPHSHLGAPRPRNRTPDQAKAPAASKKAETKHPARKGYNQPLDRA